MKAQFGETVCYNIQAEKRQLKNECTLLGLVTAGSQLFISVVIVAVSTIAIILTQSESALGLLGGLEAQIIFSVIAFIPPYLITTWIRFRSFGGIFPVRPVKAGLLIPLVLAGLSGMLVLNFLMEPYMALLTELGINTDYGSFEIPDGISGGLLYLFTAAVVPALVEEFAFRGVVLSHLRRYGNTFAILVSSLLFGLVHGNLVQIPFAFAAGCIMAYIDILTDSMLPSIIIHFLNNAISASGDLADTYLGEAGSMWLMTVIFVVCFVAGIISVWLLARKYPYAFRSAGRGNLSTVEAMKAFVGTAGFWVPVIYFGGEALVLAIGF